MKRSSVLAIQPAIDSLIRSVRGEKVILDSDLARLYGTQTGALNRAVKRNRDRFPTDFLFQISPAEWKNLKCQIGTSPEIGRHAMGAPNGRYSSPDVVS
jgi:hypothetical protein